MACGEAVTAFGGSVFARVVGIGRKFREMKCYEIAPVSNNPVLVYLGQPVLGMRKSD